MTKVVQVVFSLESSGSAGLRLHNAFLNANIDSGILSLQYGIVDNEKIQYLGWYQRLISKLDNKLQSFLTRKTIKQYGSFSYPILGTKISTNEEIKKADIIYLHWVLGGFLNLANIEQLAKLGKPVVFIMHDMWTITGGCHHSFTCEKYKSKCGDCQMFPGNKKNDLSAKLFNKKKRLYSKYSNLYFVSPSKWLYECAKSSALLKGKPIYCIPNIIDNKLFKPFNKEIAKHILNLGVNDTILAFGAVSVTSPYKGWAYLLNALNIIKKEKNNDHISILIFGSGYNKEIAEAIPFKTKFLGFLRDEYSLIIAYNATDIFIAPSLADNLPTTILESLSCGTPVVGFDVGGIPDMIKHKENGYLAKYKDAEDLAYGINFCLQNEIKGSLIPDFEQDLIIKKHQQLFDTFHTNQN